MFPQPGQNISADSVVSIGSAPAIQLDFSRGVDTADQFQSEDCAAYGNDKNLVGVYFCLAESKVHHGSIVAGEHCYSPMAGIGHGVCSTDIPNPGIYVCTNGISHDSDSCHITKPGPVPNITLTMSIHTLTVSTVCGALNNSIISVSDVGASELETSTDIKALGLAVGWLLNYTAAGLPAESSLAFQFWLSDSGAYESIWQANSYSTLKSILAFILWEFSANNNGNPVVSASEAAGQVPSLPSQFNTTASISEPFTRFVINEGVFIAYVVLQSLCLLFAWVVAIWQWFNRERVPEISSFPLVDFSSKMRIKATKGADNKSSTMVELGNLIERKFGDAKILSKLRNFQAVSLPSEGQPAVTMTRANGSESEKGAADRSQKN
jgi:hypothetical protein